MIRRIYITISLFCVLLALGANVQARSHATPTPTPKTSPRATGRLIVQRAPNFGTDLSIRLSVDGKKVADIPRNQHYGGVLAAGRHAVSALALPNTQSRRPTSIVVTIKPGKVYIFTATWDADRLVLRPSDYYSPTTRANR
ncbi:MAG TPA: hypothetical protein VM717_07000 [Chthoniobacterales bacterium]|jgi:hypothetical protein|nr:hypothetical protein [Chthoniobacterales bacterium]